MKLDIKAKISIYDDGINMGKNEDLEVRLETVKISLVFPHPIYLEKMFCFSWASIT